MYYHHVRFNLTAKRAKITESGNENIYPSYCFKISKQISVDAAMQRRLLWRSTDVTVSTMNVQNPLGSSHHDFTVPPCFKSCKEPHSFGSGSTLSLLFLLITHYFCASTTLFSHTIFNHVFKASRWFDYSTELGQCPRCWGCVGRCQHRRLRLRLRHDCTHCSQPVILTSC